ncbi:ATP-binding cassette domain-containing protein [Clostridiaceae bacterium M8S5]|nr:ATP-binding cassette domain-containing protein [Clostridiaceae bacterium M8S5]
MTNVIEINRLKKNFGNLDVIKGCNLTVMKNEIYGFLGANGAGKTTVFKMMTGLLQKDEGTIRILGLDIDTNRNEILKNIGILIEIPVFYEHLSAEENLKIHLAYMSEEADIKKTIDMVGLNGIDNRPVSKFSLGMRARLAIARAMIHNPQILILDEPVNGLDPQGIRDMRVLFKKLCIEHGKTILLSSHTLNEVEHIADTIGILANGIVAKQAKTIDIKKEYKGGLEDCYFDITGG